MSLRLKILLYIILTTSVVFVLSIGFVNYKYLNFSKKFAAKTAELYTKQAATTAQSILNGDLKTVETLENIFSGYMDIPPQYRDSLFRKMLSDILIHNNNYLAVWESWELKAIDPTWQYPYGRRRTVAYWNLGKIEIKIDSLNLNKDEPSSLYFLLKSGVERTLLTNPYFYSYSSDTGASFLETSIARGIYNGDKFVGAVGIDVSLQRFESIINDIRPFKYSQIKIISNNGTIIASDEKKEIGKKIAEKYPMLKKYYVSKRIKEGDNFSFLYNIDKEKYFTSFYSIKLEDSDMPWSLMFTVSTNIINKKIKNISILLGLLSLISLFLISIIIWFVLRMIVRPIEKTTQTLEKMSKGYIGEDIKIEHKSKDELGRMSDAVNKLIEALIATQNFAIEIGRNNLNIKYKLLSNEDVLGKALLEMRDNIKHSKEEEEKRQKETEQLNWVQNGITQINEILREHSDNLLNLTYEVIKFIVTYTKSIQGGFYLIETQEENELIVLKAAYAYDRKKEMNAEIEIGEGLIGRAVKEKREIYIKNLPEGYLFVTSGLGEKSPDKLLISPLIFEDNILGAIELAGFNDYDKVTRELVTQMSVRISSSISIMLKNIETEKLLKESQLQTATFEMKERQFVRSRKRITEQQKKLKEKEKLLEKSMQAIRSIGIYLVLNEELEIIDTNEFLPKFLEVSKDEIIGKKIDEISFFAKGSKIWQKKLWEDVKNGILRKKYTKYNYNNHTIEVNETIFSVEEAGKLEIHIVGIEKTKE